MSVAPEPRDRPAEAVAGLMASAAIFVSMIGLVHKPFRVGPVTMLVALIAVGIGGRHSRLATYAVGVAGVCWLLGMTIAILLRRPLF